MKIPCGKLGLALIIQLSGVNLIHAQTKTATGTLQAPPTKIAIDGEIKEWGDSLRYFNTEKQINYALANDKDNLYMAIKIADRSEQIRVLKGGITFSIDPKGKKKETYSITFPVNTQGTTVVIPTINNDLGPVTEEQRSQLEQEKLTTLRGIKVDGFAKDIEGDMITTSNTYGIKTALNYDDAGNLVCEAAIPISFFHTDSPTKNEWAFNFKINGIKKPAPKTGDGDQASQGGGGRGGRGGGGGGFGGGGGGRGGHGGKGGGGSHASTDGGDPNNLSKSEDFWEKFYLAK